MATHHLTTTSNIMLSRSHMVNTKDWHPSNIVMASPLKSRERSHWCSVIIINVLWQSPHSIIISHSLSSHKIIISNHLDSLKSYAMAQIWMPQHNPSAATTSSSSQTTPSSWSVYHHAELTSSQTILDSTWLDQGNGGKNRQWYGNTRRRTRMVRLCNDTKGWCHIKLKMGRSASL